MKYKTRTRCWCCLKSNYSWGAIQFQINEIENTLGISFQRKRSKNFKYFPITLWLKNMKWNRTEKHKMQGKVKTYWRMGAGCGSAKIKKSIYFLAMQEKKTFSCWPRGRGLPKISFKAFFHLFLLDAIAIEWVGGSVMFSYFGDSYRIYRACELVCGPSSQKDWILI